MNLTAIIAKREWTLTEIPMSEALKEDMRTRGWDAQFHGVSRPVGKFQKKTLESLIYRSASTGEYQTVYRLA